MGLLDSDADKIMRSEDQPRRVLTSKRKVKTSGLGIFKDLQAQSDVSVEQVRGTLHNEKSLYNEKGSLSITKADPLCNETALHNEKIVSVNDESPLYNETPLHNGDSLYNGSLLVVKPENDSNLLNEHSYSSSLYNESEAPSSTKSQEVTVQPRGQAEDLLYNKTPLCNDVSLHKESALYNESLLYNKESLYNDKLLHNDFAPSGNGRYTYHDYLKKVKTRQALTLEDKNELSLKQFIDKCDELGKAIDGDLSSANLESVKGSLVDLMLRCDTLPETISSLIGHPGLAFLSSTVLPKTLINSRSNTQRVILGSVFRLSREATVFKDIGWTDETTGKDLFDIIYKSYSEPSNLASFNGIVALLKKHGFLMSKGRPGQGGRTRFGIPRMVYNQILKAETTGTFYDIIPRPVKAPGVISKVVNDKPAQTVIGKFSLETLPPEWNEVKIPEILESRGFDRKILLQLANRKLCDPVDAKDYISWVAFDCENGKKDRRGQPISDWVSYFMASMRDDGCYSRPSNYISSEERKRIQRLKDREEEIARINALKQKEEEANRQLVALKFEEWFRILSDAHINKHYPQFARGRNTRTCREYSKELFEKTFTDVIINNPSIAVTDLSLAGENQDEARAAIEAQFGSSQKEEPENH